MTTEQHAWASSRVARIDARFRALPVCGCGQDLDMATGTNCPRCGTSLVGYAA